MSWISFRFLKKVALILLLGHLSSVVFATSIVAIRRPSSITIAADTLGVLPESIVGTPRTTSHCKIRSAGGAFFAFASFTDDVRSGFHPSRTAVARLKEAGTLEARSTRLVDSLRGSLLIAVQRVYKEDRPEIARKIIGDEEHKIAILQMLVIGIENGVAKVISANFRRVDNESHLPVGIETEVKVCPGDGCRDGEGWWLLGEQDAARKAIGQSATQFWTGNDDEDARRLVEIEIADQPKIVGGPIDVLSINPRGVSRWKEPRGKCGCAKSKAGR